jgi:CRISPR system Cascade subunit CasE
MTGLHLSRLALRRDAAVAALAPLLLPDDADARVGGAHHLLWTLFADGPDRRRDFLWRDDAGPGGRGRVFHVLSRRPPVDRLGLFDLDISEFAPALAPGDRLQFRLRANATVAVATDERPARGRRVDVVAHALARLTPEERRASRHDVMQAAGRDWLAAQGRRAGFVPAGGGDQPAVAVDGADWRVLARPGARPATFAVLDFSGIVEVADPPVFLAALAAGFGRAKAFGCGLMLIRRA